MTYIEREALLAHLFSKDDCDVMLEIAQFPAADVAPVVRCKDCKHLDKWGDDCYMCNFGRTVRVSADHFCGYGEKRED